MTVSYTRLPGALFLCLCVASACGPAPEATDVDALEQGESATVLASADQRLRVREAPSRTRDAVDVGFVAWLTEVPRAVETFVGGEPFAGLKKGRAARYEWRMPIAALARTLAGEEAHLLVEGQAGRLVASFQVAPLFKVTRGAAALQDVRASAEGLVLLFEATGEPSDFELPAGTAAIVEGLPGYFTWTLPYDDAAKLVATARAVKISARIGGRKASISLGLNVVARNPSVVDVPADFHGGVIRLAEAPIRKIDPVDADAAALRVLHALTDALEAAPDLNLNVARLAWVPGEDGGIVVYQGQGAVGPDGATHGESWWVDESVLAGRLARATGGLEVFVLPAR